MGNKCFLSLENDEIYHENKSDNLFQSDNMNIVLRWSVLALPLVIVILIMSVLLCYNGCNTQNPTQTVNKIDPHHLNMNNSAWLPSSQTAKVHMKSLKFNKGVSFDHGTKFDHGLTKATNLMRSNVKSTN